MDSTTSCLGGSIRQAATTSPATAVISPSTNAVVVVKFEDILLFPGVARIERVEALLREGNLVAY
jgi:hypothetical protein